MLGWRIKESFYILCLQLGQEGGDGWRGKRRERRIRARLCFCPSFLWVCVFLWLVQDQLNAADMWCSHAAWIERIIILKKQQGWSTFTACICCCGAVGSGLLSSVLTSTCKSLLRSHTQSQQPAANSLLMLTAYSWKSTVVKSCAGCAWGQPEQ